MPVLILPTDDPYTQSSLHFFKTVSVQCVKNIILLSSQKMCSQDPLPTSLFVECLEQLLPAVTAVINQSLQIGVFLSVFKEVIVKPFLKKPSLDPNSLKNYRPISNVSFLSKVIEKNRPLTTLSIPQRPQPLSYFPVSLQARAQCWNCPAQYDKWHAACFGQWWCNCHNSSWSVSCVRHHRSQHSLSKTWAPLWNFWYSSQLVQILPFQQNSYCYHQ